MLILKNSIKKRILFLICTPKVRHIWRCIFLWPYMLAALTGEQTVIGIHHKSHLFLGLTFTFSVSHISAPPHDMEGMGAVSYTHLTWSLQWTTYFLFTIALLLGIGFGTMFPAYNTLFVLSLIHISPHIIGLFYTEGMFVWHGHRNVRNAD